MNHVASPPVWLCSRRTALDIPGRLPRHDLAHDAGDIERIGIRFEGTYSGASSSGCAGRPVLEAASVASYSDGLRLRPTNLRDEHLL